MRQAFDEICFPFFSPILEHFDEDMDGKSDVQDFERKIFWNIGIEKTGHDLIDTLDARGEYKNPE